MTYQDRKCICRDCNEEFIFSAQDQEQFAAQQFNPPTRCPKCHEIRTHKRRHSGRPRKDMPSKVEPAPEQPVAEPNNELSFATFNLDDRLNRAIAESGYETPTPVQAATIPIALQGDDIIGTAQTGTGKTAAFALPILQYLLANPVKKRCVRAMVITPTRELAEQINDSFRQLGKHTGIVSAAVYGGVGMRPQEQALQGGADVIIACPGRLIDHMKRGNTDFSKVTKLVLDEADRMLDMGFLPYIKRIISGLPTQRHAMLFSATFAPELTDLAAGAMKSPQRIEVDAYSPAKSIAHALYPCPAHLKTALLLKLIEQTDAKSILVFTRTKHRAGSLAHDIEAAGYKTAALHADKSQTHRQQALDDFRSGKCQVLVATDIAARGLDIATISHVMNYDIPDTADTYIHRIGRTGRMEREGDAITLTAPKDAETVAEIEKALGSPIQRRRLDDFDYNIPPQRRDEYRRSPRTPEKTKPKRPLSYFAQQREARAKKFGKY